ncbi:unnamed protein product, partial [Parascedosporium putredinis]
MADENGA